MTNWPRKLDFWHGLNIGDYVLHAIAPTRWGRIVGIVDKGTHALFKVRLWNRQFIEEHPEYLRKAKPPELRGI